MSLDDLDAWLRARAGADPPPLAASLSWLDGFVSAVVAGPCGFRRDRAHHSDLMPPTVPG